MPEIQRSQLTLYGLQRIAQAHIGERMLFTSIGLGDKALLGNLNEVTELTGEKQRFPIAGSKVSGNNFWASCKPTGISDPNGIYVRAIGLYIADPVHESDRGYDKLYAVASMIPDFGNGDGYIAFIPHHAVNAEINYDIRLNTIIASTALIEIVGGIGNFGIANEELLGVIRSGGDINVNPKTGIVTINIQEHLAKYHYADHDAKVRAQGNVDIQAGGLLTFDGVPLEEDDIILLTKQTDKTENGLYLVHESSWERHPDYASGQAFTHRYIPVLMGTDRGKLYTIKNESYEIGVSELEFFETALSSKKIPGKIIIRDRNGNFEGAGSGDGGIEIIPPAMIIPPHAGVSRNLALVVLGREVTGPMDVATIHDWISATVRAGMIDNLYITPGDSDYFGLASINIQAGSDAGGAFSATLANIPGGNYGRNLDFVLIAKNPYLDKNGNTTPHVFVQSRHVLSEMTDAWHGGHYMNPTNTNAGGYAASKGRAFVTTQVKAALLAAGIPVDDTTKILPISRRMANGGSQATGTDVITDNVTLLTLYEILQITTNQTYEPTSGQAAMTFYDTDESRTKRKADGAPAQYWSASPYNDTIQFNVIAIPPSFSGIPNSGFASSGNGIAPAYAIG